MAAPDRVLELVELFERNRDHYKNPKYNETQTRVEFIDPFFEALGWDVRNLQGYAEAYKDVIHEYSLKQGASTKAPDYCFRIGGTPKFFLEAKKPAIPLKDAQKEALQVRRYAWSAKLPLSVLTDFEEFAVYDCRIKPAKSDKAGKARSMYITFDKYPEQWDDIAEIFHKDQVLKGSFDKYADSKSRRGTAEVDDAFLKDIEGWREILAKNIHTKNAGLETWELNDAVQRTIDRIVFLRICEDRGIEQYGQLQTLLNGRDTYGRLKTLFHRADDRYNSGLFHFRKENDREAPDNFTLQLEISDKPLKDVVRQLYPPESPYEFSVLPADILGQVYEQFLGKIILPTDRGVEIEDKPEVKKAGGVYYTPTFIVEYIVRNTVGKLVEGQTPEQIMGKGRKKDAHPLRVLDPACGSGSFLIGTYQFLLNWYREQYEVNPEKYTKGKQPALYQAGEKDYRLTTAERKRILLDHIYGVDIDPQAVEVTKLSLLLKVLEGESADIIGQNLALFHERALPDLADNIKCGNSLIGPDFYSQLELGLTSEDERRVNVFDWDNEFKEVFSVTKPGFDVVIGNPPYLNIDDVWGTGDVKQRYIKGTYSDIYNDKTDILFYFLRKAMLLSRNLVGFIISRAMLEAYKANKLRRVVSNSTSILEIMDFQNKPIFDGVGITTMLIFLDTNKTKGNTDFFRLIDHEKDIGRLAESRQDPEIFERLDIQRDAFGEHSWSFSASGTQSILDKLDNVGTGVGDILTVGQGMQTGRNKVFEGFPEQDISSLPSSSSYFLTRARNSDIERYCIRSSNVRILYLEDYSDFKQLPKNIRKYLSAHEAELKNRAAFRRGDCQWWKYTWPLHKELYPGRRILSPYMAKNNRFALDESGQYLGLTDTIVLFDSSQEESIGFFLALLNSRLLTFRFRFIGKLKSGGVYEYFWNSVSRLPIRRPNMDIRSEREMHDHIAHCATMATEFRSRIQLPKTQHDRTQLERRIVATDREIDQLVYKLYGLTKEEIKIIEAAT